MTNILEGGIVTVVTMKMTRLAARTDIAHGC